jgi:hypothetical protein
MEGFGRVEKKNRGEGCEDSYRICGGHSALKKLMGIEEILVEEKQSNMPCRKGNAE